jgi:hypothetical protein
MVECSLQNKNNGSFKKWRAAIEAKYYGDKSTKPLKTAEDFDQLLWQYQVRPLPLPPHTIHRPY